jgi:hypothetical protein
MQAVGLRCVARGMPAEGRDCVARGCTGRRPAICCSGNAVLRFLRSSLVWAIYAINASYRLYMGYIWYIWVICAIYGSYIGHIWVIYEYILVKYGS